jgi:hypothetical protein
MRECAVKPVLIAAAIAAVAAAACGQDDVTLPEMSAGACGPWYASSDGDAEAIFVFSEGQTCPCFVWESVRLGPQGVEPNTYINLGEVYLPAKHGNSQALASKWGVEEARALVLAVSAEGCSNCPTVLGDIAAKKSEFEDAGALMMGVCRHTMSDQEEVLPLEDADQVLVSTDSWPEVWHRTNDAEKHLPLINEYPQAAVIRLSDMKVIEFPAASMDADYLLALVQNIDQH